MDSTANTFDTLNPLYKKVYASPSERRKRFNKIRQLLNKGK